MNYEKIGFKSGIEVHQQICSKKLFCSCSTDFKEEKQQIEFIRKLKASKSEIGEIDAAAKFEELKNREFVYHGFNNEFCLVDCDSEPPHKVNEEALETALQVAILLKLRIPQVIIPMRKVVLDGSACSSFQRTMIVGLESENSFIETSKGRVKVSQLCLEEDACKIMKTEKNKVHYSLSRQGIPLLEIRTEPDIKSPEQLREAAEYISMVVKSTGKAKGGIGTIRQDVNLSIKKGNRVEIKGFQDIRDIKKVVEKEVKRQLKVKKVKSEVRKVNSDATTSFLRPMPGSARMYPETDVRPIETKNLVKSIKLPDLISDKIKKIEKKYKISKDLAKELIKKSIDLEDYVKKYKKLDAKTILKVLIRIPKDIKTRHKLDISVLNEGNFDFVLEKLNKNEINLDAVLDILIAKIKGEKVDFKKFKCVSNKELEQEIKKLIEKNKDLSIKALMGIIMGKYRGKCDGRKVIEILKKYKEV